MEPTLNTHLRALAEAVEDYRHSVKQMQDLFAFEVEALWKDQADLRDEVNATATALGNRIEGLTRGLTADPAEVAKAMLARGGPIKACPDCAGFGKVTKTAENATEPGPMGMQQKCVTCEGSGAIYV